MTEEKIKETWRKLLIPFIIGLIVFIISLLFHRLGSKKATPQVLSFFGCIFGLIFMFFPGIKMVKFRKYIRVLKDS